MNNNTPWRRSILNTHVYDNQDNFIELPDDYKQHIVHCVNNHTPLIDALKTCITWFTDNQDVDFPIGDYTKAVETYIKATTTP